MKKTLIFSCILLGFGLLLVNYGSAGYIPEGSQSLGVYEGSFSGDRYGGSVRIHLYQSPQGTQLFEGDFANPDNARRDYDLEYPAGKRFLMVEEFEPEVANTKLVYVENWAEELVGLVPTD